MNYMQSLDSLIRAEHRDSFTTETEYKGPINVTDEIEYENKREYSSCHIYFTLSHIEPKSLLSTMVIIIAVRINYDP